MSRPALEIGDVCRQHGDAFLRQRGASLSPTQRRALRDLAACRTSALGGHVEACDRCGFGRVSYNSCRNRHCPKCQGGKRAAWLADRQAELLPVPYFHLVFTLPAELAPLALQNPAAVYGLLLRVAAETILQVGADPRRLGAELGVLAVLHTWGRNMHHHPHVHCIVPGGGFRPGRAQWITAKPDYFLPVRVLSRVFRGKFMEGLRRLHAGGRLRFHGRLADLTRTDRWNSLLASAVRQEWVVYAKPPWGGPEQALKYLARYVHGVAISNRRLVSMEDGRVAFRWKDHADGGRTKTMTLAAEEFLRRFLLHVLPRGFVKIRSYGFLANGCRRERLAAARKLLAPQGAALPMPPKNPEAADTPKEHAPQCPHCREGRLLRIGTLPRLRDAPPPLVRPPPWLPPSPGACVAS